MEFFLVILAVVVVWCLFRTSRYKIVSLFEQAEDQDIHGEPTGADFDTFRGLKKAVVGSFKNYACPSCGTHKVSGSGVLVRYGKVRLFRQEMHKGWFGGVKHKDVHYRTVWRIHEVGLRNAPGRAFLNFFGAFDDPPGELKCNARGCAWSVRGERGGTISLGEVLNALRGG